MPAKPRRGGLHPAFDRLAQAVSGGEMVHHDQSPARPQHPPGLIERPLGMGNDAHDIGGERHLECGVGELERGRIHDVEALDLGEAQSRDPRPGGAQHRRADVDAGGMNVFGQQRQFEPSADPDHQNLAARPGRLRRRLRRGESSSVKRQIEYEVVNRRPAAIGRLRVMPRVAAESRRSDSPGSALTPASGSARRSCLA